MKIESMETKTALEQGLLLPFAFIRSLSGAALGPTPAEVNAEELEELVEARFFDEHCEIRIFRRDGVLSAARLEEEPGDKILRNEYLLDNPKFGVSVTECRCLDTESDEDGQAFIAAVRLAGWRGAS